MKNVVLTICLMVAVSLLSAQPFNFDGVASGTTGAMGNGWVGAPTINFRWQADNGGTGSPSTGPAVDHTTGTALGIYIYTEASSPAIQGDEATLTSPDLDLTAFTSPGLEFWYHMYGGDMGNLYVEYDNNGVWTALDSIIGQTQFADTDPWLRRQVNLIGLGDTIVIRFRGTRGAGFTGDMAIDDVTIVELPPFEPGFTRIDPLSPYVQVPISQINAPLAVTGEVTNSGVDTSLAVRVIANVGSYLQFADIDSILPGAAVDFMMPVPYTPTVGEVSPIYSLSSSQQDADLSNNSGFGPSFTVSDSIYARDDSSLVGSLGIGAGTAGVIGQIFEVTTRDTLTSVSFFLNAPPDSQFIWVDIYNFDGAVPTTIFATTDTLFIPTENPSWYTLSICPTVLEPGTYFLGVNETDENITLGYNTAFFQPSTSFVIFGANPWEPSEFYGFPVSYLLRANFGSSASLSIGPDLTICSDATVPISVPAGFSNPLWFGTAPLDTLFVSDPGQVFVVAEDAKGCTYADTLLVSEFPAPVPGIGESLQVCANDGVLLLANLLTGMPDAGGVWTDDDNSGAVVGTAFDPALAAPGTYNLTYTVTDTCGVDTAATATVEVLAAPSAGNDGGISLCTDIGTVFDLNTLLSGGAQSGGVWNDDDNSGGLTGRAFDPTAVTAGVYNVSYIVPSAGCGSDTATMTIKVSACLSLNGADISWFNLYPNPNQGVFQLTFGTETAADKTIRIYDAVGQQVYSESLTTMVNAHQVDVSNLPAGIYTLELRAGEQVGQRQLNIR